MNKTKVSQDFLYDNIVKHGVNVKAIAELMGISVTMVNGCLRHDKDMHGNPRNFPAKTLPKLNAALEQLAEQLNQSLITFGSDQTYTNNRGTQYDPAAVDGIQALRKYFKLTPFLKDALGWTENKKSIVLHTPSSKGYACVSAQDVRRINAAITQVAVLFGGIEVVAEGNSSI